mgnify:CR=1 FL=1
MTARSRGFACATLLLVFALGASEGGKKKGGEAAKEDAAPQTWYAQLFTHGDTIVRVDHTWSKGRKLRSELVVQGRSYLTLVSGDRYIIIDQTGGTGIAIRRSPEAIAGQAERFDLLGRLRHHPFPGGRWLRTPALVLAMLWFRLRDLL